MPTSSIAMPIGIRSASSSEHRDDADQAQSRSLGDIVPVPSHLPRND